MPKRSSKKYDPNATPFSIVQKITESPQNPETPTLELSLGNAETRKRIMQEMGRRGGLKGGKARASALSKTRKVEIAKRAAAARWGKKKTK
jgi:hypothetical protein